MLYTWTQNREARMYDHSPPPQHFQQLAKKLPFNLASIIKIPPAAGQKDVSFKDLPCSDQDKSNIFELVTTLAENGKLSLLVKQSYLKNLGAQINHVHPLKFLATIFSHPRLKNCMCDVFSDYFKRSGFMDGLGASLNREADKGKLEFYLHEFSGEIKLPPEKIKEYFQSRDWENMVWFFIQS